MFTFIYIDIFIYTHIILDTEWIWSYLVIYSFIHTSEVCCVSKESSDPLFLLLLSFLRLGFGLLLRLFPGFLLLFESLNPRVAVVGRVCMTSHTHWHTHTQTDAHGKITCPCRTSYLPTSVRILFISSFFLWAREARFCFSIHLLSSRLMQTRDSGSLG